MMDLSIVIVNYNSKQFILDLLKSIKKYYSKELEENKYEIIIVDNASTDKSTEAIKKLKTLNLKLIENKENSGFSRANNIGIRQTSGRYILFLNPDTLVYEDTLSGMVEFMDRHPEAGAATCRVVMGNGEIDDASHRGFPTPWNSLMYFTGLAKTFPKSRIFNGYHMGWLKMNKTHEIDALAGAFMIVRRQAGEAADWWDEDYFFYGEDLDFCYVLKQKKWKIYYVPDIKVFHHKGISGGIKKISQSKTTADLKTRIRATNERYRAMILFYDKHYLNKYPYFVTALTKIAIRIKLSKSLNEITKG